MKTNRTVTIGCSWDLVALDDGKLWPVDASQCERLINRHAIGHRADDRPSADPEQRAELLSLRGELEAALAELPPRLRAVVVLRDVYDLPHEAIAAELGITETAAKVRLHRARLRLRERLFTVETGERRHAAG